MKRCHVPTITAPFLSAVLTAACGSARSETDGGGPLQGGSAGAAAADSAGVEGGRPEAAGMGGRAPRCQCRDPYGVGTNGACGAWFFPFIGDCVIPNPTAPLQTGDFNVVVNLNCVTDLGSDSTDPDGYWSYDAASNTIVIAEPACSTLKEQGGACAVVAVGGSILACGGGA